MFIKVKNNLRFKGKMRKNIYAERFVKANRFMLKPFFLPSL